MASRKTWGQILPRFLVRAFRRARFAAMDAIDRCRGRADAMTPPRWLQAFVGARSDDFSAPGEEFYAHFRRLGRLQPNESVLDIGCGVGRMAIPLLGFLGPEGRYVGFDISPQAIRWCADHIAAKNPRFSFHVADIYNKEYNPRGTCRAAEHRFPCADGSVDFAFAASVFSHMLPDDVRRYLAEIHRVLKPGGRGLFTHFILNAESEAAMSRPGSCRHFLFPLPECRTIDRDVPERAIAFDEAVLRRMYAEAGMTIAEPIRFGAWSGRAGGLSYQDIVLAGKEGLAIRE